LLKLKAKTVSDSEELNTLQEETTTQTQKPESEDKEEKKSNGAHTPV
jgi:hypothetical protein